MIDPHEDGTKHLNVTYNAKTPLGRMLSPPYPVEIEIPDHGTFESVGGYWLWQLSGRKEKFRSFSGEKCFVESKHPPAQQTVASEPFQKKILKATWLKIRQNQKIFWRFEQNILSFRRYYVGEQNILIPSDAEWFCDGLEKMTSYIEKNFW